MVEQLVLFFLKDALFLLGYLARGSAFPKPLDRDEEARMIERMQQGDAKARETLIEHNLRLAAHIARKYTVPGYDADDLISIGTVGLIKGVNTFKPGSGTQLSTYCARCIENEILMCLRSSQKRKGEVSLHEPIGTDNEGNEITLIDVLGTDEGEVHGEVERRISLQSVRGLVSTCLHGRERTVLEMRYGLLDGTVHAQQEVAEKLGISRSYVSRIEKKAMDRLKVAFETGKAATGE
ncbi:MAG: RNA polymerase sporulation sigma factor SigK [Clostridia bacterium]|nr:RNA polymerase sporulation sigma factor SigK [Clostridia bacterium]